MAVDVHIPVLLARKDARIVWAADLSPVALRRARQRYGLRGVLLTGDPRELPPADIVLLALPVGVRAAYHRELSSRGCHVYVEKPFARTQKEALTILQAYPAGRLACGYQRRFYPSTDRLRELVATGQYGRVRRVRVSEGALTMATGMSSTYRDETEMGGGGILIDLGCHGIDLAFQITGATDSDILRQCLVFDGAIDREVTLSAVLTGGPLPVELLVELSWLGHRTGEFVVEFEHATARIGVKPGDEFELSVEGSVSTPAPPTHRPLNVPSVWTAVDCAWSALLSAEKGDRFDSLDPRTSIPTVTLIQQAYAGARVT
jgi:predicted dehydrogenase